MTSSHPRRGVLLLALLLVGLVVTSAPAAAADPDLPRGRWPVPGSPRVVGAFAPPSTPYGTGHRGVDLAATRGTPVLAAAAGSVSFAGSVAGRGVVSVTHGDVRTTYEPVSPLVTVGQPVRAGEVLGTVAPGGHCREGCLHWGLRRGAEYLDPLLLVRRSSAVALVGADQQARARWAASQRALLATAARAAVDAAGWVRGPGRSHGFTRPVLGPVSSAFGLRLHPVLGVWKLHDGTDFAAPCGTPIRAPHAGRVTAVVSHPAYGNRLMLEHGRVDGRSVRTSYNHAQRYLVAPGAPVVQGQLLGYVGNTGWSTGCHLHLMVWLDGALTNPMTWLT